MQIIITELAKESDGVAAASDLSYDRFTLILQSLCHPLSCPDKRSLRKAFKLLQKIFTEDKLNELFSQNLDQMI